MENKEANVKTVSSENIYRLNGRVPLSKAIPFGLQHVLAMFVSNLAPVLIVCSAALVRGTENHLTAVEITRLLQCAMFAAGIGTCMQLYPIWKIGSKLPIVMGVSFTFLGSLLIICTNPNLGYEGMIGAVILGGIFEGLVGLSARYWKRFLTPVVSSCVVIAIGLSLLPVGMNSWGGGSGAADFGSWHHLLVGLFTLLVCLVSRYLLKGVYKNLNILVGLIAGYILAGILTLAGVAPLVDFSGIGKTVGEIGFFSLPRPVFFTGHMPVFDLGAFFTIAIVFLVGTLLGALALRTQMVEISFESSQVQTRIERLSQDVEERQTQLDMLKASLPERAQEMGMVPQEGSISIDLNGYQPSEGGTQ